MTRWGSCATPYATSSPTSRCRTERGFAWTAIGSTFPDAPPARRRRCERPASAVAGGLGNVVAVGQDPRAQRPAQQPAPAPALPAREPRPDAQRGESAHQRPAGGDQLRGAGEVNQDLVARLADQQERD